MVSVEVGVIIGVNVSAWVFCAGMLWSKVSDIHATNAEILTEMKRINGNVDKQGEAIAGIKATCKAREKICPGMKRMRNEDS